MQDLYHSVLYIFIGLTQLRLNKF